MYISYVHIISQQWSDNQHLLGCLTDDLTHNYCIASNSQPTVHTTFATRLSQCAAIHFLPSYSSLSGLVSTLTRRWVMRIGARVALLCPMPIPLELDRLPIAVVDVAAALCCAALVRPLSKGNAWNHWPSVFNSTYWSIRAQRRAAGTSKCVSTPSFYVPRLGRCQSCGLFALPPTALYEAAV